MASKRVAEGPPSDSEDGSSVSKMTKLDDDAIPNSTSEINHPMPHIPNEIWGEVLQHLPVAILWRKCRHVSKAFRKEAEFITSKRFRLNDRFRYSKAVKESSRVHVSVGCTFKGLDEHRTLAKFDVVLSRLPKCIDTQPTIEAILGAFLRNVFMRVPCLILDQDVPSPAVRQHVCAVVCGCMNYCQISVDWKALLQAYFAEGDPEAIPPQNMAVVIDYLTQSENSSMSVQEVVVLRKR